MISQDVTVQAPMEGFHWPDIPELQFHPLQLQAPQSRKQARGEFPRMG